MSRGMICLATAAFAIAACGPSFAQPSPADDPANWDAGQKATYNASFARTTHDSCLSAAQSRGVAPDVAERYCSCVVSRLQPLSVEDKMALARRQDTMMAASEACKSH